MELKLVQFSWSKTERFGIDESYQKFVKESLSEFLAGVDMVDMSLTGVSSSSSFMSGLVVIRYKKNADKKAKVEAAATAKINKASAEARKAVADTAAAVAKKAADEAKTKADEAKKAADLAKEAK